MTGLVVSEIAYGSWLTFSNQVELANAKKIIKSAFDAGINYFDTADVYERGKAEILLGEVLPENFSRSEYVIATKCFFPMSDSILNKGLSRKHIMDSIEGSLERLQLDYVDIFYAHRYDPDTPLEETLAAMDDVVKSGMSIYWGVSEWSADQIDEACSLCEENGWSKPIVDQPRYSLISREIEKEIIPSCEKNDMGIAAFSPLAQGVLTGKYSNGKIPVGSRASNDRQNMWMKDEIANLALLSKIDSLKPIAEGYSLSIAQLSLAWALRLNGITSLIIGASSEKQLNENLKASGVKLDQGTIDQMNALFPLQ
jgi:voltage-dependent potassium channel beta subunit